MYCMELEVVSRYSHNSSYRSYTSCKGIRVHVDFSQHLGIYCILSLSLSQGLESHLDILHFHCYGLNSQWGILIHDFRNGLIPPGLMGSRAH